MNSDVVVGVVVVVVFVVVFVVGILVSFSVADSVCVGLVLRPPLRLVTLCNVSGEPSFTKIACVT